MKSLEFGFLKDYNIHYQIGYGSTCDVFEGSHKLLPEYPLAIKIIREDGLTAMQKHQLKRELETVRQLNNHRHIIKTFEIIESYEGENNVDQMTGSENIVSDLKNVNNTNSNTNTNTNNNNNKIVEDSRKGKIIAIIMEFAENGSLYDLLVGKQNGLSSQVTGKYINQIASAIYYLHYEKGIIHRDLKAENILMDFCFSAKLADFGMSCEINNKNPLDNNNNIINNDNENDGLKSENQKNDQISSTLSNDIIRTRCGSPTYVSPELILSGNYDEKTDIWSLGVLTYLMTTGQFPFFDENIQILFDKIVKEEPCFPPFFDENLKDLILKMLEKDPKKRCTILEVLNSKFLYSIDTPLLPKINTKAKNGGRSNENDMINEKVFEEMMKILNLDRENVVRLIKIDKKNEIIVLFRILKSRFLNRKHVTEQKLITHKSLNSINSMRSIHMGRPLFSILRSPINNIPIVSTKTLSSSTDNSRNASGSCQSDSDGVINHDLIINNSYHSTKNFSPSNLSEFKSNSSSMYNGVSVMAGTNCGRVFGRKSCIRGVLSNKSMGGPLGGLKPLRE